MGMWLLLGVVVIGIAIGALVALAVVIRIVYGRDAIERFPVEGVVCIYMIYLPILFWAADFDVQIWMRAVQFLIMSWFKAFVMWLVFCLIVKAIDKIRNFLREIREIREYSKEIRDALKEREQS